LADLAAFFYRRILAGIEKSILNFRQVADKLKLGQSVEPESFDCVTSKLPFNLVIKSSFYQLKFFTCLFIYQFSVFFSDVVSFTNLAARCTPLQVISLLNEFYTTLDSIIAEFDVYKVETIGNIKFEVVCITII
jgi:hypothetical protein